MPGVGAEQAALADRDDLLAAAGQRAHDRGAAADVGAVADDHARRDPALDHRGAERAGVEVDEALVHHGRAVGEVRAEPHAVGVGDADARRAPRSRPCGGTCRRRRPCSDGPRRAQPQPRPPRSRRRRTGRGWSRRRWRAAPKMPSRLSAVRRDQAVGQQVQPQVGVVRRRRAGRRARRRRCATTSDATPRGRRPRQPREVGGDVGGRRARAQAPGTRCRGGPVRRDGGQARPGGRSAAQCAHGRPRYTPTRRVTPRGVRGDARVPARADHPDRRATCRYRRANARHRRLTTTPGVSSSSHVQRTTRSPSSRTRSSRRFSATTASPGVCPGRSSRPYLTRPSNSPTVRRSGHPKSVVRGRPCGGTGPPTAEPVAAVWNRASRILLRDSPTLCPPPSANAATRRAFGVAGPSPRSLHGQAQPCRSTRPRALRPRRRRRARTVPPAPQRPRSARARSPVCRRSR